MSIYQPIKMPVSVFSSEDTDAPQLSSNGAAGEIKAILKACLITGYGSTTAQDGWAMPFEDGNKAVFKSIDPRATGFCLRIDNAGQNWADVACYEEMTDINTGTNRFFNKSTGFANNSSYNERRTWLLYATSSAFMLVTNVVVRGGNNQIAFFFGDMLSTLVTDDYNCLVYAVTRSGNGAASISSPGPAVLTRSDSRIARNYLAEIGEAEASIASMFNFRSTRINANGGHLSFPVNVMENGNVVRLIAPFSISNRAERISTEEVTISGRKYHITNLGNGSSSPVYFIPTDYWLL